MDLLVLQMIFYDLTAMRKTIGRRLHEKGGPLEGLYDGDCRICRRTMDILSRLDIFERLRLMNFREQAPIDEKRAGIPALSQETLAKEMHVLRGKRLFLGFDGYRQLAQVLPLGWLIAPFLWLPGVSWMGKQVYARVASGRLGASACSGTH